MIHTKRPSSSNKGAQLAWDFLTGMNPESLIKEMWYTRSMDDGLWIAQYQNLHYEEVSVLSVNSWKINGAPTNYEEMIVERERNRTASVPK